MRSLAVFRQKTWADASKHRKRCESSHLCPLWRFLGRSDGGYQTFLTDDYHIHTIVGTPTRTRELAGQRKPRHVVQRSSLPPHLSFGLRHMRPLVRHRWSDDV